MKVFKFAFWKNWSHQNVFSKLTDLYKHRALEPVPWIHEELEEKRRLKKEQEEKEQNEKDQQKDEHGESNVSSYENQVDQEPQALELQELSVNHQDDP